VSSVIRNSTSRREARRARIVEQMLLVVQELLDGGEAFTDITVEQLISKAGISRSTFYVYFEDKGVLLLALAQDVVEHLVSAATAWWNLPPEATKDDLEKALRGIIDVYAQHASIWAALVDTSSYDPNVRASFQSIVDLAVDGVAGHIRDGQHNGSVRSGLDPKRTAQWLTWMTERGLYQLIPDASANEIKKLCRAQTDLVWYTLYEGA